MQGKLGNGCAAMKASTQQAFQRQGSDGLSHRVAGDTQQGSQGYFLQLATRTEFALKDALTEQGSDLVGHTDAIDLRAIHENRLQGSPVRQSSGILPRFVHVVKC